MTTALEIDLLAGEFYTSNPYPTYARMRADAPLYWDATNELWGASRYDDIVAIEKDRVRFVNSDQTKGGYRPNIPADQSIIGLDDPVHNHRRNLISRRFTPRAVSSWEDHVRDVCVELIDSALAAGRCDIVRDVAAPLPAQMIGLLLGFPHELWPKLMEWSERTIALGGGPRYHNEEGIVAVFEFHAACADLYEAKSACPADDVMSKWIAVEKEHGQVGGKPFGFDEMVSDCLLVLDGGAETTRTVIARTILNLIDRPDQWAALRAGADLTVATEEFIRYVTPIHNMCRVATEDVPIGGITVSAGQQVVLMYSSANRDPAHFTDPEAFDVTRDPNPHLSFGFGTHFCLGAALARLEIRVFFEEFVRRVRSIRRAPGTREVEMPNAFVFGLAEAAVELTPA